MTVVKSMVVLSLVGLVDSVSFMSVTPSLIFYVLQVGGDKERYGLIMSAFSFASFCGKPLYGIWVDKGGNKFRAPYLASFFLATIGAILYFFANSCTSTPWALGLILVGRLLGGFGGANQTLGYAYTASVFPQDQQTRTNTILSMTRIVGMAGGPAVNLLLQKINTTWTFGGFSIGVDPLNSVGLLLAAGNMLAATAVYLFLEEPPEKDKKLVELAAAETGTQSNATIWKALLKMDILLPVYILLIINSAFQLIETGFPPVAADGLGWGPVETSAVLGSNSIVMFLCMACTVILSGKIHDYIMVAMGTCGWLIGGTGMYLLWVRGAPAWHYVLPIIVACTGFPFVAPANRSNFTKAVAAEPALEGSQAFMQSVLSMASSVAGFTTPGLVAAYVVRSPDEVTASSDQRELTPFALYVTVTTVLALMGLWKLFRDEQKSFAQATDVPASEATGLVDHGVNQSRRRSSAVALAQACSRKSEVCRRESVQIMGIVAPDTLEERKVNEQLMKDWEEWKEMNDLEYE
eukprot:Nitzschia sp. Nitz4//scaffold41_size133979//106218//107941//NITZ4_003365-RA/size133979-snap-gene-0.133-mRNA-1//-1//CDS//3329551524//6442//frame0